MSNFSIEAPLNGLSLGQVSICILKELQRRKLEPSIFPLGKTDLSAFKVDNEFNGWLQ